jgi:hypothetical protein
VFDVLPEDLPRGRRDRRLDINTEGLLLLTNDGGSRASSPIRRRMDAPLPHPRYGDITQADLDR